MSFSPRPSPFKRPESPVTRTPSTVRAATPNASPTKTFATPSKPSSPMLSPERQSPFVRRPSQLASDRPKSPFARPSSRLSVADTPDATPEPASRQEASADVFAPQSPSPTILEPGAQFDGLPSSPPTVLSPSPSRPAAPTARPSMQRTLTSSTANTVRPFPIQTSSQPLSTQPSARQTFANTIGGYTHVPQPLLRSMRESFEVLDSSNSGTISSSDVSTMLSQLGLDDSSASLSSFFPPNGPSTTLNLARFLDTLSAPMADLSHADELMAAFGAFDVDDSGQIDVAELRDALVHTAPDPEIRGGKMEERDIDAVLAEFAGRRAFGGKGVLGKELGAGGGKRGEVFRYRDFMAGISGAGSGDAGAMAA